MFICYKCERKKKFDYNFWKEIKFDDFIDIGWVF